MLYASAANCACGLLNPECCAAVQASDKQQSPLTAAVPQLAESSTKPASHMFLAQAPLTGALHSLTQDLVQPPAIANLHVASTNIWMNHSAVSTSAHYDPHHNLLCVLCGHKRVTLWPPSSTPHLKPHCFCGESSNHSSIAMHDRHAFADATTAATEQGRFFQIDLHATDALFLPAGWWHEVESIDKTIAVNYWCGLGSADVRHQAPFHLRHALHACLHTECKRVLACMRGSSQAYIQEHACIHQGCKLPVATAAELLHRHASDRRMGSEPAAVGYRGAVACDAVALAALGQQQVLWLLDLWHRVAPEMLAHWLLQCMSPAAAEVLTDTLENPPEDAMHGSHTGLSSDGWAHESRTKARSAKGAGNASLCDRLHSVCESPCGEGDNRQRAVGDVAASRAAIHHVQTGGAEGTFCVPNCERDRFDIVADLSAIVEMGNGEIVLGEFAKQVAAVEHQLQAVGAGNPGLHNVSVELPGLEVLGKVFGRVDTTLLTQRLESLKSRWREECLIHVLKSHL